MFLRSHSGVFLVALFLVFAASVARGQTIRNVYAVDTTNPVTPGEISLAEAVCAKTGNHHFNRLGTGTVQAELIDRRLQMAEAARWHRTGIASDERCGLHISAEWRSGRHRSQIKQ